MFNFLSMANNYEDRMVGRYEVDDVFVSTCSVTDGDQPYETAVGHPDYNDGELVIVEAYETRAEAADGHIRWVETMTSDKLPEHLRDCANSEWAFGRNVIYPRTETQ